MRLEFILPPREHRHALRAQLARLQQPGPALDLLCPVVPTDFHPSSVTCMAQSVHPDRFVVRATLRSSAGEERSYALKVYADDFGEQVWTFARSLAAFQRGERDGPLVPFHYVPGDRVLISRWVAGEPLSEIVDDRKSALLRRAARVIAELHHAPIIPDDRTPAPVIVERALARCERMCATWPEVIPVIKPLMVTLEEAASSLDPAQPSPVHGDLGAGQFLWTGDRLVLLDLDAFGYSDPAYDAGHFLAQLERRCLIDGIPAARTCEWLAAFLDTYVASMPAVSPRNVSFYRGLALLRKLSTIRRAYPASWPALVERIANRVRAALYGEGIPRR